MNISCFLVSEGKFQPAILPEDILLGLVKSLRTKGNEMVHFADKSIEVEGVYIPSKTSKTRFIAFSDIEE